MHQYRLQALHGLYDWLKTEKQGDWVVLGSTNEQDTPKADSVEEWARSAENPIGDFYGVTPHFRGRFATYIPAILELFGFVELEGSGIYTIGFTVSVRSRQ